MLAASPEEQAKRFWLPPGFAHGFLALTEHAVVSIRGTTPLVGTDGKTLHWADPTVAVPWPLPPGTAAMSASWRARSSVASASTVSPKHSRARLASI